MLLVHGRRIGGKEVKSCNLNLGSGKEATTSLFLSRTPRGRSWSRGSGQRRPRTTRGGEQDSRLLAESEWLLKKSWKDQIHGQEENVVGMIASNAKEREEEIAGEKVFVMTFGAMNVGWKSVHTKGRRGGTATPGEESIRTIWKPEMRRNLCSGYILFTITRGGWTCPTRCEPLGATPTPWTGSFRRGSISPTLRGPYWWTGGTRWEE